MVEPTPGRDNSQQPVYGLGTLSDICGSIRSDIACPAHDTAEVVHQITDCVVPLEKSIRPLIIG